MSDQNTNTPTQAGHLAAFPPAPGSVAASEWRAYPATQPATMDWYMVYHGGGDEGSGYLPGAEFALYTPETDTWEAADRYGPLADGCRVTHWAEVIPPNTKLSEPTASL